MTNDEQEIRELVATWLAATKAGDVEKVLLLMADDAVFLMPGRPLMHKAEFARASQAQAGVDAPQIEGTSTIHELTIFGDWAYMWTTLKITVTPPDGAAKVTRAGNTLTVLKKQNGKWLLARDANMLVQVPG